jgi:hypothetical protein
MLLKHYSMIVTGIIIGFFTYSHCAVSAGFRFGFGMANVSAKDDNGMDPLFESGCKHPDRTGINGTVFIDAAITPWLSFVPEIGFAGRGFALEPVIPTGNTDSLTLTIKNNYLIIPFSLKLHPSIWKVQPYLQIGPEIGFLLQSTGKMPGQTYDFEKGFNNVDFGLDFSTGVEIKIKKFLPFLQIGYYCGLTNSAKANITMQNRGITIQSGLRYQI